MPQTTSTGETRKGRLITGLVRFAVLLPILVLAVGFMTDWSWGQSDPVVVAPTDDPVASFRVVEPRGEGRADASSNDDGAVKADWTYTAGPKGRTSGNK
jgi:hypothetical protein